MSEKTQTKKQVMDSLCEIIDVATFWAVTMIPESDVEQRGMEYSRRLAMNHIAETANGLFAFVEDCHE